MAMATPLATAALTGPRAAAGRSSKSASPRHAAGLVVKRPLVQVPHARGARVVSVRASDDDLPAPGLSKEEAYEILGLSAGATFDDVVRAKNKMLSSVGQDDLEKKVQVEAAYDILFMQNMQARLSGESDVLPSVKYADVPPPKTAGQIAKEVVSKLPGGLSVSTPAQNDLVTASGVFGALAVWALIGACTEPPSAAAADTASLQVAVGLGTSVYLLREKKRLGLGRAAALTGAGLVLGCLVGAGVESWLRVDIVPIGSFSSPGVLVSEFGLLGVWAVCAFLA